VPDANRNLRFLATGFRSLSECSFAEPKRLRLFHAADRPASPLKCRTRSWRGGSGSLVAFRVSRYDQGLMPNYNQLPDGNPWGNMKSAFRRREPCWQRSKAELKDLLKNRERTTFFFSECCLR